MDFTKFSDENFDLKDWINGAFMSQKETNQNLEQFVATLITKLQVFIQEINHSIDDTSQSTVQNFPRILRDIEVLKQETFMLKEQMKSVRDDLIKVEKNTVNESMKSLLDLDIMRTNMLNIKLALQEADNWTTLTSDLDSILATKDINAISSHIESMQNSLTLLQDDSSDYASRCALLEDFKNKFESFISPELISAFNSKSIELCKNYVEIFGKMNRLNDSKKYYYQCEKSKILDKYSELMGTTTTSASTTSDPAASLVSVQQMDGAALQSFLKNWFDHLIEVWQREAHWCKQIFADAHLIVVNLLTKTLEEFNKNFTRLLDTLLADTRNYDHIELLNQFKQEHDRFAQTIFSSAESSGLLKNSQLNDLVYKMFMQLYSPYRGHTKQYGTMVLKHLRNQLDKNIRMNHSDTVECVQLLSNSVNKIFHLIEKEIARCATYTNGCGLSMLIDSIKTFLKVYIDEFKRIVLNLKERRQAASLSTTPSSMSHSASSAMLTSAASSASLASMAAGGSKSADEEDWETFRHFVKLIQIVGDLMIKYDLLEDTLCKQIQANFLLHSSTVGKVKQALAASTSIVGKLPPPLAAMSSSSSSDLEQHFNLLSVSNYKDYLLDDADKSKLNKLIGVIESSVASAAAAAALIADADAGTGGSGGGVSGSGSGGEANGSGAITGTTITNYVIMKDLLKPLYMLSENVHKYAFDIVFAPVKSLLKDLSKSSLWTKNESTSKQQETVPLFALAPQEYITKIGQYLLTLPQNFEPFTMQDNDNLIVALKKSKLPYLDEEELSEDITACWLDSIANATAITFSDEILNIQQIPVNAQRQLIIDIEFIVSVFEDVGLKDYGNVIHALELLKAERDQFDELTRSKPARVVSAIRKMRNL